MFVDEFSTMAEPEGDDEGSAFALDYSFPKMNLSSTNEEITQIYSVEECMEMFGNQSNVPSNVGCLEHAPILTQSTMIKSFVLSVMAILSLLGNVATMLSIKKSKRHRAAHIYTLIYHLSIADLFVTFWCILGDAIWSLTVEWKAGNIECKLFKFFQMFSLYLSTFIMVLIGVDRFIAVKYPLKSMRKGLCFRLIAVCWSMSAILSLPQMVVFHVKQGPFTEEFYQCVTYGFYTAEWQEHFYTVFTLVCGFILPLFILVSTYILTVVTLHRNEEIMDQTGSFRTLIDPNRRKLIRRAKMKSLRISVAIVVTFLICWTPYYVMMITYLFFVPNKDARISEDLYSGFFFFGMSNSVFNPLIYGIFHIWTPRRKELQRGISSRRTLLTNLSFQRQRSNGTLINGSIVSRNGHVDIGGHSHADTMSSNPHHHLLQRNGTQGTMSSVKTLNSSFSNKPLTPATKEEKFLNRQNSLNLNLHSNHNNLNNHLNNLSHMTIKEDPKIETATTILRTSPTLTAPDTHICICTNNKKNLTSGNNVIENHV